MVSRPGGRRELLAEIEGHLSEAIDPGASDAQALTVLDKLGEPEAIIAAETPPRDELPERRGTREWAAIILLLFGGFIFGFGWFAGLILLWSSRAWTTRDKWIGTLVIPGGLATSVFIGLFAIGTPTKKYCYGFAGGVQHCTNAAGQSSGPRILGIARLRVPRARPDRDLGLSRPPRGLSHRHNKSNEALAGEPHALTERRTGKQALTARRP